MSACALSASLVGSDSAGLEPHPVVPPEHARSVANESDPTPESPAVRYRTGYDSFWWNCVALKSEDPEARCPLACSGTAAAAAGCARGALDSERMVAALIRSVGADEARKRLRTRVGRTDAQQSLRRYFASGPQREGPAL